MAGRGRAPYPRGGMARHPPPPPPRPPLLDDPPTLPPAARFARGCPPLPLPPMMGVDARMAAEMEEASALLLDNQRLAATHVALMQELHTARAEFERATRSFDASQRDRDNRIREIYDKSLKLEVGLRGFDEMKAELKHVNGELQNLHSGRQELMAKVQELTVELSRSSAELQQIPVLKADIEAVRQETQRVRDGIETEKKGYTEIYEQGQMMEKNLVSMAREVEKLRAEISNAEKRARAAVAAGSQGYGGNYGNTNPSYMANTYAGAYGMNQISSVADNALQYGASSTQGAWNAYEMQRTQGRR